MPNETVASISFYIVAHADDWQLFMQPNVYYDLLNPHCKVVFIISTAGDAGADETYWASREEGSNSSIRFCMAPTTNLYEDRGTIECNGQTLHFSSVNNITTYFFRLPDGNLDGNGFERYHGQSLSKFKAGIITSISAVDGSAVYNNWKDFCSTLQALIQLESRGITNIRVNYLNPQTSENPNDHIDHVTTGNAIQEMEIAPVLTHTLFVGYNVKNAKEKLEPKDLFWKAGMLAAYEKAVYDGSGYSTLKESVPTYVGWCLSTAKFTTIAGMIKKAANNSAHVK